MAPQFCSDATSLLIVTLQNVDFNNAPVPNYWAINMQCDPWPTPERNREVVLYGMDSYRFRPRRNNARKSDFFIRCTIHRHTIRTANEIPGAMTKLKK